MTVPSAAELRPPRSVVVLAVGVALGLGASIVWWLGFDWPWALAAALALGSVAVAIARIELTEHDRWQAPERDTPRGTILTAATLARSLAACDRLARPDVVQRLRALVVSDRDDQAARAVLLRRVRALLGAELQARGLDPTQVTHHEAIGMLLGADVLAVLQPGNSSPITAAAVEQWLDRLDQLHTEPHAAE